MSGFRTPVYQRIVPDGVAWSDRITFSPAVRVGDFIYVSGLTATDDQHRIVGVGDIVAQTRQIFAKMARILAAAGAGMEHVVETTDYFISLEDYSRTAEVRREVFHGPPYPAATGVRVAGLIRPEALIEIKAVAICPKASP